MKGSRSESLTIRQKEMLRGIHQGDVHFLLDLLAFENVGTTLQFELNENKTTPLMYACSLGQPNVVRVVLNSIDVSQTTRDSRGFNCLHYAVQHGHLAVATLLKRSDTPYIASNDGTTCLHIAVRKGHTEIVDFLLSKPVTQYMKAKRKLLKKATWLENIVSAENKGQPHHDVDAAQEKWEKKVHVDERKLEQGITSVFIAVATGNIQMLDLLRKYGADFRMQAQVSGGEFMQPIHLACKLGNIKVVEVLLEKDDNPAELMDTVTLPSHNTVMHMAAQGGKTDMIDFLTAKGISTIAKNAQDEIPLHSAIRSGHKDFALMLIDGYKKNKVEASDVNIESKFDKMTPYALAVVGGLFALSEVILTQGYAQKDQKNSDGETVEDVAQRLCSRRACSYLGLPQPSKERKRDLSVRIRQQRQAMEAKRELTVSAIQRIKIGVTTVMSESNNGSVVSSPTQQSSLKMPRTISLPKAQLMRRMMSRAVETEPDQLDKINSDDEQAIEDHHASMPLAIDPLKLQETAKKMTHFAGGRQNTAILSTGSQQQGHVLDNDIGSLQQKLDLNNDKHGFASLKDRISRIMTPTNHKEVQQSPIKPLTQGRHNEMPNLKTVAATTESIVSQYLTMPHKVSSVESLDASATDKKGLRVKSNDSRVDNPLPMGGHIKVQEFIKEMQRQKQNQQMSRARAV